MPDASSRSIGAITYTKIHLPRIINQPLEGRQSANHSNPDSDAVPQPREADIAVNTTHSLARALAGLAVAVKLRHHDVRGMRDNGAADTGDVAAEERNARLLQPVESRLGLADVRVDGIDGALKRREFHHRVRYLPAPQRHEPIVQAAEALLGHDLAPPFAQVVGVRREGRLHADLDGLEGAEEDVGDELGAGGRAEKDYGLVGVGEELFAVLVFEDFVEAVFACALEAVAYEGGGPAEDWDRLVSGLMLRLISFRGSSSLGKESMKRRRPVVMTELYNGFGEKGESSQMPRSPSLLAIVRHACMLEL